MTPLRPVVLASLVAAAALAWPVAAAQQREVRDRHVFVGVTDKNDDPVKGLTAADFVVREDGLAREVVRVDAAPAPTHVALLVDDSHYASLAQVTQDLRNGLPVLTHAIQAVDPSTQFTIYTLADRPTRILPYTNAVAPIDKAIGGLFPREGAGAYLINAVIDVCREFRSRSALRPIIVVFVLEDSPEFSDELHQRAATALQNTGASLWVVTMQSRLNELPTDGMRERLLLTNDDAKSSGGMNLTVLSKLGLTTGFTRLASVITSRYDVVYGRPESMIPPKNLEVSLRNKTNTTVLARKWAGE